MILEVTQRQGQTYGRMIIDPVNEEAKTFARRFRAVSLNERMLEDAIQLGYDVRVVVKPNALQDLVVKLKAAKRRGKKKAS